MTKIIKLSDKFKASLKVEVIDLHYGNETSLIWGLKFYSHN